MSRARSIIVIQRQTWSPFRLGQQLVAWWDPSFGVTSAGGLVSAWADKIGGATAVQGTGSLQPSVSTSNINGYPGLVFDGTDDLLTISSVPAAFPTGGSPGWLFGLANQTALSSDPVIARQVVGYGSTGAGANQRQTGLIITGGNNRGRAFDGSLASTGTVVDFSGVHSIFGEFTGTTVGGAVDGNAFTPVASSQTTATTRVRIGANLSGTAVQYWMGGISHVMVGSGTLSTINRQRLEAWALWSVGKQDNLPTTHPYRYRRP